jgi:hypothetical protein
MDTNETIRTMTHTFNEAQAKRNKEYAGRWAPANHGSVDLDAALVSLNKDGFVYLKNLLPVELVSEIRAKMASSISNRINVSQPKKVVESSAWSPLVTSGYGGEDTQSVRLSEEEFAMGPDHYRKLINYIDIKEPFVNIPETLEIAFNDTILEMAERYLEAFPGVGYIKMRRSLVNSLGDFDTTYFHFDGNSVRTLKAFVYLHDVDEQGGPTTYVPGSHVNRFPGWGFDGRYSYDQIASIYGEKNITYLTAKAGDVVLGDPGGCHRGTKPIAADRDIIIINYGIHPEYGFVGGDLTMEGAATVQIAKKDYDALSEKHAAAADFLDVLSSS